MPEIEDLRTPLPPLDEQRRIADFLDAQVALLRRAGKLVARQLQLVNDRENSLLHQNTTLYGAPVVPVKRVVSRLTSGPRGWGSLLADDGVPFIRIANVPRRGISLLLSNLAYVDVPPGAERERTRTRTGDVLVSITADIGSVGIVEGGAVGGNVSQHVALLRPIVDRCSSRWLAYALKAPAANTALRMSSYGGTKVGLGLADVAETVIPMPSLAEQSRLVRRIDEAMEWAEVSRAALTRKKALLAEREGTLVTAAVTGDLDVATAAGAKA